MFYDSSGMLDSVSKLALTAPLVGCSILDDTKLTNQNDSAEGCSILDTKITAGVELINQNDSAEGYISETLV